MPQTIKELRNNRRVIFDQGSFDHWCVYVVEENGSSFAPLDAQYFADLLKISQKYNEDKVYNDFVLIYEKTTKNISEEALKLIDEIVKTYNEDDQILIEQWFSVIYAGMIAEENKQRAILKKRIKRLGMHQVLKLGMSAYEAANFSHGKKWRELDAIMNPLGF